MEGLCDDESSTEHDEELPFALVEDCATPQSASAMAIGRFPLTSSATTTTCPPGLQSSVVSNPTDGESETSSYFGHSSLLQPPSQYLDAAASLLHPSSSLLNISLTKSHIATIPGHSQSVSTELASCEPSKAGTEAPSGFSALLQAADDKHDNTSARLPALPEDELYHSSTSVLIEASDAPVHVSTPDYGHQQGCSSSCDDLNWFPPQLLGLVGGQRKRQQYSSQTILPAVSPSTSLFRNEERRLASLAGATASRTGDLSFQVSLDLSNSCSNVRDVMDVVGNPDLLTMWCDPIPGLIIVRSSEGARNAANLDGRMAPDADRGREYEGEWVEATTPQLVAPANTSCVYATSRTVSNALGFPTYGRVVMFVERLRGHVGLTIGPFPGNIEVMYKIRVESTCGRIRIVNDVRLQRDSGYEDGTALCGMWDLLEKCLLPTVDDYMDQVLSSFARLRFLVENGETSMYVGRSPEFGPSSTPLLAVL